MSAPRRCLVDTNVLLRFLLGEPPAHATAARDLCGRAHAGDVVLEITPIVVAETFYTLTSFYRLGRAEAAGNLALLLQQRGVKVRDGDAVRSALDRLRVGNVAFADAFLAATAAESGLPVASFDRDLDKFKDITRYEPGT